MADINETLMARAKGLMVGGVNSPVRAFGAVGGAPRFIARGEGSHVWDAEGRKYLDYVGSWGPCILGHAYGKVVQAVQEAAAKGMSFGAPTEGEIRLAAKVIERVSSVKKVRLVNSGTEATMTALRLARAFTGRDKVVKFAGCYHGHGDSFLVQAGSGAMTLGIPSSSGVTAGTAGDTVVARFNDVGSVRELMEKWKGQIAAVFVEPVVGNAGVIPPADGFLQSLRELTEEEGIVLVFDEVMTGFRVAPGGAQELYGVMPDLTTMGKVIGGGLPIGAVGGREEVMDLLSPVGGVYQAGTLSGNPLAVAAGLATLGELRSAVYERLEELGAMLEEGMRGNLARLGLGYQVQRVGSMACLFFTDAAVNDYEGAKGCDVEKFARYYHGMLERGIYLPPSQFEAFFLSAVHTPADIEVTIKANYESLAGLR